MDPHTVFCPNWDCPARGQTGAGNLQVHSQKDQRYLCRVCGKTFTATRGTVRYRLRASLDLVTVVVTWLAYGCPLQAIVMAFGLEERTVRRWQQRAGQHAEPVHQQWVQQPRDLGQVQADELRVKKQGTMVWLATAWQVRTRLWLGGALDAQRNLALITELMGQVRASALGGPLLLCADGFSAYGRAIRQVFREPVRTGRRGRGQGG